MDKQKHLLKKIITSAIILTMLASVMAGCSGKDKEPTLPKDAATTASQITNTTTNAPATTTSTTAGDPTSETTSATTPQSSASATVTKGSQTKLPTSAHTMTTTSATKPTTKPTTAPTDDSDETNSVEKVTEIFDFTCDFPDTEVKIEVYNDPKNGKRLPYRLYMPANYDPSKKYPVLLVLHGAGEMGNNNSLQLHNVKKIFECNGDIVSQGFVLCPQTDEWWALGGSQLTGKLGSVLHLLEEVQNTYSCDADRIYVTGLSMGGYATWDLLANYGHLFAAGMPVCGGNNQIGNAAAMKDIPLKIYHSKDDGTLPFSYSEDTYNAIVAAGGKMAEFIVLDGYNHNAWDYAYADRDAFSWLYAQKKSTYGIDSYEYVPYFTVRDSKGNVVISEEDVRMMYYIGGYDENEKYVITLNMMLTDSGLSKLEKAYTGKSNTFTVYWANEKLYTYTASGAPQSNIFAMVGIFNDETVTKFYETVNWILENRD
ncbi:MAG: hypothetical protein IJP35_00265 [Clostridia bacterium]|nr:hypothetical protein [Clostridia bacterium]